MAPTLFDVEPKPGDLIEMERALYCHWAVYIGNNEVVHLLPAGDDLLSMMDSSSAVVRRQRLSAVASSGGFRVNNLLDDKYAPREWEVIVAEACKLVGKTLLYNLASYNCEHFATTLRYGKPESRQARTAEGAAVAFGAVAVVALGAALFGALLGGAETRENERERERERAKRNRRGRRY